MTASGTNSLPTLGFLTVVENPDHGLFGGLLVLNVAGRPLEFHCTAPVKPNRAQEILYGDTLRPYLFGEQIGGTLLKKLKKQPALVCTDSEPVLAARSTTTSPLVLVDPDGAESESSSGETTTARIDRPHDTAAPRGLMKFRAGSHALAVAKPFEQDRDKALGVYNQHCDDLDLSEPFARIREAIEEAQRAAR